MAKFKVGDKVRVKNKTPEWFEATDNANGRAGLFDELIGYAIDRTILTVRNVSGAGNFRCDPGYGGKWYYAPNWLEPVNKFKGN